MPYTHTPGPWKLYGHTNDDHYIIYVDNDHQIAHVPYNKRHADGNARLITAAPDLLDALQAMIEQAEEDYPHPESPRWTENIQHAKNAVTKAVEFEWKKGV